MHLSGLTGSIACMNGKSRVLVFMGCLSNSHSVPISIVTVYFEAPRRQAQCLSDSLFSPL